MDWIYRFADSFDRYFGGCVMEYYARLSREPMDLKEYRRLRSWSIGTFPVFDLIELAHEQLAPLAAKKPELERLKDRAALLCAWANDIYSHDKEMADGDPVNLVSVIAHEYDLSLEDAYGAAAEVFNIDLVLFEQEREALLENGAPALLRYCSGLEDWVFGNLQWTALCDRYRRGVVAAP